MRRGILRRRANPQPPPAEHITAAAARIPLGTERGTGRGKGAAKVRPPQQWQSDGWDAYDQIGQVKASYNFIGNSLARLRFFPAVQLEEDESPVHVDVAAGRADEAPEDLRADPAITPELADAITAELARVTNPLGGQPELLRVSGICLGVPGECYLVGRTIPATPATDTPLLPAPPAADDDRRREVWDVYSPNELRRDPSTTDDEPVIVIVESDASTAEGTRLTENDVVIRVWRRHPRWKNQPDSHMRAALTDCDEILAASRGFQATMMSRNNAGILTFPAELNNRGTDEHGDPTGDGTDNGKPRPSDLLADSMIAPVADPANASSVVPHLIVGKADYLKPDVLRHISLARDWPAVAAEARKEAVHRLAQGLPLPPEMVEGLSDVNHWNAWFIGRETYEAHIEPEATLIADAWCEGIIRPALRAQGFDDAAVAAARIGIDASQLVVDPSRLDKMKDLHGVYVISDAALRRAANVPETDAPDDEELQRRMATKGIINDALTLALMKLAGLVPESTAIETASTELPAGTEPEDEEDGEGEGPPPMNEPSPTAPAMAAALTAAASVDLGARLGRIDARLRERLTVEASAAVRRALHTAGARLRAKGQKDEAVARAARDHPNGALAAALGPTIVAALGLPAEQLVPDDAFDGLRDQWDRLVERAQTETLNAISRGGELADAERAELEREQERDREAGWLLLAAALVALARARLFSPDPEDAEQAEFDPTLAVPPGIVREALARAGGAAHVGAVASSTGVDSGGGVGAARRLLDSAGRPAGGVSTGELAHRALVRAGLAVSGYLWEYGDPSLRQRNFGPHQALDGLVVASWDETVLRVDSSFGWVASGHWYPGDHGWCQCSWSFVVRQAEVTAV